MNRKRILLGVVIAILSVVMTEFILSAAYTPNDIGYNMDNSYNISTESNFFGKPEDQTLVELPADYLNELSIKGYQAVAETDSIRLFVKEQNFNIAIYDKASGYLWYSVYKDYTSLGLSGTSRYFIESGVVIEYFNMDNILIDDTKSYLSGPKFNVNADYDYDSVENGLVAHIEFEDLGIQFDVVVRIEDDRLIVHLPMDTLVEEDIEKPMLNLDGTVTTRSYSYRLKSVYLFPYFGSNNYEINGYSFIPDGSGALIRYNENRSSTAYIKRIYGSDEGLLRFNDNQNTYYLQDEMTASLPIFGVNHGYQQAAFLAEITEGSGYTEIHSYPYGYNSYFLNTTFAKYIVRERYTIQTSSNDSDSFQLINNDPYPTDYTTEYHFLSNQNASYSGMANAYKESLNLQNQSDDPAVNISFIGMDYKSSLFGKNYIEMTTYSDVIDITTDLASLGVTNLDLMYMAWNKCGFYDNTPIKPKVARNLGGTKDFEAMMDYLASSGIDMYFYNNPLISFDQALGSKVIKKITLSTFVTDSVQSSLFDRTYYTNPMNIAQSILDDERRYETLDIHNLALDSVGKSLFSYRYNSTNYYRNQTIDIMTSELEQLADYNIALYKPNSYLWSLIDAYHEAPIESNKYAYITDSIPFIQLVLSGSVNMYSDYVNYVSDYDTMSLRLIEYGVCPSFLITNESTHLLRYTNSEYIYTSEYALWKDTIKMISDKVIDPLQQVSGEEMISHRYIASGLAEITYESGTIIYVNYTDEAIIISPSITVEAGNVKVVTSE